MTKDIKVVNSNSDPFANEESIKVTQIYYRNKQPKKLDLKAHLNVK